MPWGRWWARWRVSTWARVRVALRSGHYANVLRLDDKQGLALSSDGVGTKVILCEQLRRFDTVGIDRWR